MIGKARLYEEQYRVPVIAQLVERRTVVVLLSSLGHWFESGSRDIFFYY